MFEPSFEVLAAKYETGQSCLMSTRLIADLETPVSAFLKLSSGRNGGIFLLESVEGGAARGRYSMIGLEPDIVLLIVGAKAEINRGSLASADAFVPCGKPPLAALRELIAESRIESADNMPP